MKSRPNPPDRSEAVDATAAAWLAQRDDGFSPDDAAAFARWRAADPRHEAAVVRLEAAWAALARLRDFRPGAAAHPDRDLLAPPRRAPVIRFPALAGVAACAAAVMFAALWWWQRPAAGARAQTHATTVGGYERIALEDGSIVELNAGSEIRVRYTAAERRVQLVRGEAHFTVAKNPARPFRVTAGTIAVRAVGTAFDVRLEGHEVAVLVTEGRVQIEHPPAPLSPVPPAPAPVVSAGERVVLSVAPAMPAAPAPALPAPPPPVVQKVAPAVIRQVLAWQGPRLLFIETPLAEVVAQFNAHNAVKLELADPALATLPVGGSFQAENVEAFVRLLALNRDLVVDRPDPARLVIRRATP
jgi:transmembrane sensor